jgi:hypothetical protein
MLDISESEESPRSPFSIEPIGQLGAVTGRFVHDLANEISCAATVMSLVHDIETEGPPSKEDLDELNSALERAVALIHRFGATVRTLRPPPVPIVFSELLPKIREFFSHYKALPLTLAAKIPDPTDDVVCNAAWLIHCIDYGARLFAPCSGTATLSVVAAAKAKPPVDYYSVDKAPSFLKISFTAANCPDLPTLNLSKIDENMELFITRELLRHMRGFLVIKSEKDHAELSIHLGLFPKPEGD